MDGSCLWEPTLIADRLGDPWVGELTGVAQATGLPIGDLVVMNLFYELVRAFASKTRPVHSLTPAALARANRTRAAPPSWHKWATGH